MWDETVDAIEAVRRPVVARPRTGVRRRRRVDDPRVAAMDTSYEPNPDGLPDPGEVVWAWVAYEDDPSQGKDRPVILLARGTGELSSQWLALMLTSKDHDRDAEDEARWGRYWMDVGSGGWDREGRPSEVRLDRLLVLDDSAIRREGAALDRGIFEAVVAAARKHHALP